jgi:protein pelota
VRASKIEYSELSRNIGGKYNIKERDARKKEFYSELRDFITGLAAREAVVNAVLAGSGFEKENFFRFLSENPTQSNLKFVVENTGSHGRRGVVEVLKRPSAGKMLGELNAARDIQFMEEVLEKIGRDSGLAAYGLGEVKKASSYGAIEKLLVSDRLFLSERKTLEPIMTDVKGKAGFVHIINHETEAGAQLESLGGIAAVLRFKIQ